MSEIPESNVDRLTGQLRSMAANFEIKPEERIVEGDMARRLSVSRTPLREALNRLVSEGYLTFRGGQGFFCRALTPERIMDLYEARAGVECEGLRLAAARAGADDIRALLEFDEPAQPTRLELLEMDERFHMGLVRLSRNSELERMLANINGRIRYVRMIGLDVVGGAACQIEAHRGIVIALASGNVAAAETSLRAHIALRKEDATQAVRAAFSELYVRTG